VEADLDRIKALGTDIVYLLPIQPIGVKNRKGTLGSPYSIRDYRAINPELGTLADFQSLIAAVHAHKMQLMLDVVYNHTSRDSVLLKTHPEWFYKNAKGEFANRVGEWWDVTDFYYTKDLGLWKELADTLAYFATLGVDGFRCDVASLVPVDFWLYARKVVAKVKKNVVWLSESVHGSFLKYIRDLGFGAWSEAEIYQAFDMAYDYDVQPYMEQYLLGKRPLRDYLEALRRQEEMYPANYVKMKHLENHDCTRIAEYVKNDLDKVRNWNAFSFFQKGSILLYAGTEYASDKRPDLFEKDVFVKKTDITALIQKLTKLKKKPIFANGIYTIELPEVDGVVYNHFHDSSESWHGIFNLGQVQGSIVVKLPDGTYLNYLGGTKITVKNSQITLGKTPIIIRHLQ
jgi:glycosidase